MYVPCPSTIFFLLWLDAKLLCGHQQVDCAATPGSTTATVTAADGERVRSSGGAEWSEAGRSTPSTAFTAAFSTLLDSNQNPSSIISKSQLGNVDTSLSKNAALSDMETTGSGTSCIFTQTPITTAGRWDFVETWSSP
jgi:hypothetical protein